MPAENAKRKGVRKDIEGRKQEFHGETEGKREDEEEMGGVSAPSGYARGSFAGLDSGTEQTRRITPDQGRERERARERGKGGGRNWSAGSQKAGHAESLLALGCVSHFTSSLAVAKAQRRGQEEGGGEGGTLRQLSLSLSVSHTQTH